MTALEQLGAYVAGGAVASSLQPLAALHLVDVVGAWVAGRTTPEGRALIRFSPGHDPLDRLVVNCGTARLSEVDDIHLSSLVTPGAAIVPAALTLAGTAADPTRLREAILVGYDAMVRLGTAIGGPTILYRGIWPSYFAAPFGVAAVASRLFGLNERQAAHALALALNFAAPSVGHQGGPATSRWLAFGLAARNGVVAARAAQAGFTSDLGLFEGTFLRQAYNITPELAALTDGLGTRIVLSEVSFKPWCAARQTMAATQALKELLADGVALDETSEISAAIPGIQTKMVDHGVVAGDRPSHLTSLPYHLALAALRPDGAFDVAQAPASVPDDIRALMTRIKVQADDSLAADYPRIWAARVTVRTRSGARERTVTHIPGDPARAFDDAQLAQKFHRIVAAACGESLSERLLGLARAAADGAVPPLLDAIGQVNP
jgi:2-methylcitrate dehydratase PrpD